jgi:hypothetical protein
MLGFWQFTKGRTVLLLHKELKMLKKKIVIGRCALNPREKILKIMQAGACEFWQHTCGVITKGKLV